MALIDDLEPGDVVWFNGAMISHNALIIAIDREAEEITVAGEVAEHGIEGGAAETYPIDLWQPVEAQVNSVITDMSDEEKRSLFGGTEEEIEE